MIETKGRQLGADATLAADYASLHDSVAAVDLSDRGRMRFTGIGAKDALNGVLTCDVAPLISGGGAYGVALTSKGKVVADVTVYANDESLLVECPPGAWTGWQQLIMKYVNPRMAKRTDETESTGELGLFGPDASRVASLLTGTDRAALDALPPYHHLANAGSDVIDVARIPDLGVDGFRVIVGRAALVALRANALAHGARMIGEAAVDAARVEAGRPLWGVDMDDTTIPQEANLDMFGAISYTKGCYTGQELVARLHFRGHVNRRLMGLRLDGSTAPARGAELASLEGTVIGDVRSSAVSPRFGLIALGMVRREVDAGAAVSVRAADGTSMSAQVVELPFGG